MTNRDARSGGSVQVDTHLSGTRNAFVRLAFAFLSGGRAFWLFLMAIPLALFVTSRWVHSGVSIFLFGIPALFLLGYWVSAYRYLSPSITIDPEGNELTLDHSDLPVWSWSKSIDLDDLSGISTIHVADVAFVRLDYNESNFFTIYDFVIPQSALPEVIAVLQDGGADVTPATVRKQRWWDVEPAVRIFATPLLLVGVPVYGVIAFGPSVLLGSDIAIVAWVLAIWTVVRHFTHRFDLRPQDRGRQILFDIAVSTVLIAVGVGVVLAFLLATG